MRTTNWTRITVAAAAVGLLTACEQPTEVSEDFSLAALTAPIAGLPAQLIVCKDGPSPGTYTFRVTGSSLTLQAGVDPVTGEFTLEDEECLHVATAASAPDTAAVEEIGTSDPLNTFLLSKVYFIPPGETQTLATPADSGAVNPRTGITFGDRGAVIVFVNQREITGEGCTLTQGYWKTHGDPTNTKKFDETWNDPDVGGPNSTFLHGLSWITVLETAPKQGNAWFILAHQYIAAFLNVQNGADPVSPDDITDELAEALALLTFWDTDDLTSKATGTAADARADAIELAGILDAWNNGISGPGHCEGDVPLD